MGKWTLQVIPCHKADWALAQSRGKHGNSWITRLADGSGRCRALRRGAARQGAALGKL